MSTASRQPNWDIYEAAILHEAVLSVEAGKETRKDAIRRASAELRKIAIAKGISIDETYRNTNGIAFQFQSMEFSAFGRESVTQKTGSRVFDEVVSLYKNENDKYNRILSDAHAMSKRDTASSTTENRNLKETFREWLLESGKKVGLVDYIVSGFSDVSDYAIEKKIIVSPLFEIHDSKAFNRAVNDIQGYKFFRVLKRDLYKFLMSYSKTYFSFLKNRITTPTKTQNSTPVEKETHIISEDDKELIENFGEIFSGVYRLLQQNDRHVYLTAEQVCRALSADIEAVTNILEKASWSERLGDGYILGHNKHEDSKKCRFNFTDSFNAFTKVETIISENFKRGFRPNSIMDRNRFVSLFEEKYGEEIVIEDLINEVQECCFRFDERFFLPKSLIEQSAMKRIADYMVGHFEKNEILFYNVLFSAFETECGSYVYSAEMLAALLQKVLHGTPIYYSGRYCSVKMDAKPDVTTEVVDYLIRMDDPRSYDDIYHDLSHLNQSDIYNALHYNNPEILGNSKTEYFHVESAHINDGEREVIRSIASTLLNSSKYITCNEIMENLSSSSHELMERLTAKFSTLGIRRILTYYLRSDFNVGTGIVTRKSLKLTVEDVFADFAKTHSHFTVDDVQRLSEYTGTVPYWEPIHAHAVRINSTDFVQPSDLDFDVEGIDSAIDFYCTEYIPLREISDYSRFPSCGTPWNIFLLQQYVFRFSEQFKLLSLGFSKGNASGVIVRKQSEYPDFESVVIDALEKTKIVTPNDAMDFLCEKGFISERRYKKHAELLKIAVMRRNKD